MPRQKKPVPTADDATTSPDMAGLDTGDATGQQPRRRAVGRPRSRASRDAVLQAAYRLLIDAGLDAFSIEAVAAHAGVAKTTIYRWWPSRGKLAFESFLEAYRPALAYDFEAPPAAGLRALIVSLVAALSGPAARLTTSIIAEAQRDEDVRTLFRESFSAPLRARSEALIRGGMTAGAFRADLDPTKVIDAFVGAVYLRLIFGLSIGPAWADGLADTLLRGCETS